MDFTLPIGQPTLHWSTLYVKQVAFQNSLTAGTLATGQLACITASNTIGQCTGTPSAGYIGILLDAVTGNYASNGSNAVINLDATVSVTFGDFICASATAAGKGHDNGATPCSANTWIGTATTTAASVANTNAAITIH
jgi:hypothetical protein